MIEATMLAAHPEKRTFMSSSIAIERRRLEVQSWDAAAP
jgi:hypothetical protein